MTGQERIQKQVQAIDDETVQAFLNLFFPRQDIYAQQRDRGRCPYVWAHAPVTLQLIRAHLIGEITLGSYALRADNRAQWVVVDADTPEQWQEVQQIAPSSPHPVYLEQSRRGGHAWMFFEHPEQGSDARRFARSMFNHVLLDTIEIYPKQSELVDGPGSLIRVPFGIHRKTHKRYGFITPDGQPLAPTLREQITLLVHSAECFPHSYVFSMATALAQDPHPTPTEPFRVQPTSPELPVSERIKRAISVLDFVQRYIALDRQHLGFCPFHNDEHRSFGVNVNRNYWSCFAECGTPKGGSVIDFWMRWRAMEGRDSSFKATVADLADLLRLT